MEGCGCFGLREEGRRDTKRCRKGKGEKQGLKDKDSAVSIPMEIEWRVKVLKANAELGPRSQWRGERRTTGMAKTLRFREGADAGGLICKGVSE